MGAAPFSRVLDHVVDDGRHLLFGRADFKTTNHQLMLPVGVATVQHLSSDSEELVVDIPRFEPALQTRPDLIMEHRSLFVIHVGRPNRGQPHLLGVPTGRKQLEERTWCHRNFSSVPSLLRIVVDNTSPLDVDPRNEPDDIGKLIVALSGDPFSSWDRVEQVVAVPALADFPERLG